MVFKYIGKSFMRKLKIHVWCKKFFLDKLVIMVCSAAAYFFSKNGGWSEKMAEGVLFLWKWSSNTPRKSISKPMKEKTDVTKNHYVEKLPYKTYVKRVFLIKSSRYM